MGYSREGTCKPVRVVHSVCRIRSRRNQTGALSSILADARFESCEMTGIVVGALAVSCRVRVSSGAAEDLHFSSLVSMRSSLLPKPARGIQHGDYGGACAWGTGGDHGRRLIPRSLNGTCGCLGLTRCGSDQCRHRSPADGRCVAQRGDAIRATTIPEPIRVAGDFHTDPCLV